MGPDTILQESLVNEEPDEDLTSKFRHCANADLALSTQDTREQVEQLRS